MRSLILRIINQVKNDKRTLMLLIFAPILVLTLIYLLLGDSNYTPKIAVYDIPDVIVSNLKESVTVLNIDKNIDINEYLKSGSADAVFYFKGKVINLVMLEANSKSSIVMTSIKNTINKVTNNSNNITTSFVYGSEDKNQFENLGYVFLGILSFFFVFIIAGMSLVRERIHQTMERMLMTPIKRSKIIGGYIIGYGILAAVQSIIIVVYASYILKITSITSILLCILVMILLSFIAVSLGALLSIFANNEFQIVQFIPVVIIPQIFFSGLIPIDTIPFGLGNLAYVMPIFYGCTALKMIIIESAGLINILPWITSLCVYIIILFVLNILALKKYREI